MVVVMAGAVYASPTTPRNRYCRGGEVTGRSDRTQMDEVNMLYEKFTEPRRRSVDR